MTMTLCINDF